MAKCYFKAIDTVISIKIKVYLQVLLTPNNITKLTCKSTKYLKVPVLQGKSYHEYKTHKLYDRNPVNIYIIKNSIYEKSHVGDWINMFYVKNDIVYFTKYFDDKKIAIKPIYDYRSRMFEFIKLDREEHGEVSSNAIYVKSPNGNLYVVYRRTIQVGDNKAVGCIVYNYTKHRIVHRAIGEAHSRIVYTAPIANSFVPLVTINQKEVYIELVNLVEENVEVIKYSLNDFISKVPSIIQDTVPKSYIKKLIRAPISGYIDQEEYPKYIMTKHKESVPIYKKVILSINITDKEDSFVISNAILIAVVFENNELGIELSTGEESYIDVEQSKIGKIKIESHVVLLKKNYRFSTTYDITKSHLYKVNEVGSNFILSDRSLYVLQDSNKNNYLVFDYYDGRLSFNNVDLILTYKHILLSQTKTHSKTISNIGMYQLTYWKYKIKYVRCDSNGRVGINLLDLKKLYYQFGRSLNIGQKNDIIIQNIDDLKIYVNTDEIIRRIICEKENGNYKKVECIYTYYLDKLREVLYIVMIPFYYRDDTYRQYAYSVAIVEIEPRRSSRDYRIVLNMGPYLYETIDERNMVSLNDMLKMNNKFKDILALYEIISTLRRAAIHVDNIYYSNLNVLGHELFIYNQEILVKISGEYVEIKDIMHNRMVSFRHWIQYHFFAPIIRQYDNVIMCYWGDSDSSSDEQKLYIVVIISENNIVNHIAL
jgi:hypothetical protein